MKVFAILSFIALISLPAQALCSMNVRFQPFAESSCSQPTKHHHEKKIRADRCYNFKKPFRSYQVREGKKTKKLAALGCTFKVFDLPNCGSANSSYPPIPASFGACGAANFFTNDGAGRAGRSALLDCSKPFIAAAPIPDRKAESTFVKVPFLTKTSTFSKNFTTTATVTQTVLPIPAVETQTQTQTITESPSASQSTVHSVIQLLSPQVETETRVKTVTSTSQLPKTVLHLAEPRRSTSTVETTTTTVVVPPKTSTTVCWTTDLPKRSAGLVEKIAC